MLYCLDASQESRNGASSRSVRCPRPSEEHEALPQRGVADPAPAELTCRPAVVHPCSHPFSTLTQQLHAPWAGHQRWVWDCVFSVDAAYLVTASSDCSARLWDLSTGDAIRMYSGHHKAAVCCALNDSAIEGRDAE